MAEKHLFYLNRNKVCVCVCVRVCYILLLLIQPCFMSLEVLGFQGVIPWGKKNRQK